MNHSKTRILSKVLGVLVGIMVLQGLAGCGGPEAQKPLPPTDVKTIPGGTSQKEYQGSMQDKAKNMGK